MSESTPLPADDATPRLAGRIVALVALLYVVAVFAATYPFVWSFAKGLPGSLFDPLQHLWIVKWYKTCLLEGRSPVISPELNHPVGAPLGNFSPLHLQALLFLPLSFVFSEVVSFNLIWLTGIVTTGLGTFLLIWHVLKDARCAAVGGLLAMLSGPMLLHARAHLELVFVGCFPLFLVAWMRFVEAPSRRRLLAAVGAYLLVALCAAYYAVFAAVPAALYVAWLGAGAMRRRDRGWLGSRALWLGRFAALAAPLLALVFGNQLYAMSQGYSIARPMSEYRSFGTPPWTYLVPTIIHPLSAPLPVDLYVVYGGFEHIGERVSYLGLVSLGLLILAAATRTSFPNRGFWWATLATLVVLSGGAYWQVGRWQVPLPGLWLKQHLFVFRLIRVPARFNLFAGVIAALVAAAALKEALRGTPGRLRRGALVAGLAAFAMLDLSTPNFPAAEIPKMPAAYDFIKRQNPEAALVEVPQATSGGSTIYSTAGYWQSLHRLRTNAGYSGHGNFPFDNRLSFNSPFYQTALNNPGFAEGAGATAFDIVANVDALDYAWLYLHANRFDYVVLHEWSRATSDGDPDPAALAPLKRMLEPAKVFEEPGIATVYDRARLRPPTRAVPLTTTGWRMGWGGRLMRVAGPEARIAVYNPDPDRAVKFVLDASGFPRAREVRLLGDDGAELARWRVAPGAPSLHLSGPLRLPAGLQELVLVSDGESRPRRPEQQATEWDALPYSLWVSGIALIDSEAHEREEQELKQGRPPQLTEQTDGARRAVR